MIENKERIEAEIDVYWKVITTDVGDEKAKELVDKLRFEEEDQEFVQNKIDLRKLITNTQTPLKQHHRRSSGQASQGEQAKL